MKTVEKDMKTVYQIATRRLRGERGQNQDLTVISKGYEDRLPDNKRPSTRYKKTTWRDYVEREDRTKTSL